MLIFWRLMFGHLLADFTLQSNFINRWKRNSHWGMLAHCATHPICYLALTYPFLGEIWVDLGFAGLNGWVCVALLFIAHYMEDQWRVFTIFRYNTPDNTLYFLWDQIIHYAVIFAVIPVGVLSGEAALMPEKWPVLGCLFVIVTHASTIFLYFLEKDIKDRAFPGLEEKYLGMVERLVLALCFLVPGNFWPLLALGWFSLAHAARARFFGDFSRFNYFTGGALAAACGILGRIVCYA